MTELFFGSDRFLPAAARIAGFSALRSWGIFFPRRANKNGLCYWCLFRVLYHPALQTETIYIIRDGLIAVVALNRKNIQFAIIVRFILRRKLKGDAPQNERAVPDNYQAGRAHQATERIHRRGLWNASSSFSGLQTLVTNELLFNMWLWADRRI